MLRLPGKRRVKSVGVIGYAAVIARSGPGKPTAGGTVRVAVPEVIPGKDGRAVHAPQRLATRGSSTVGIVAVGEPVTIIVDVIGKIGLCRGQGSRGPQAGMRSHPIDAHRHRGTVSRG